MPVNAAEFIKIVTPPVIKMHRPKIVIGGHGARQSEKVSCLDEFGIDYLIGGEARRKDFCVRIYTTIFRVTSKKKI